MNSRFLHFKIAIAEQPQLFGKTSLDLTAVEPEKVIPFIYLYFIYFSFDSQSCTARFEISVLGLTLLTYLKGDCGNSCKMLWYENSTQAYYTDFLKRSNGSLLKPNLISCELSRVIFSAKRYTLPLFRRIARVSLFKVWSDLR